MSRSKKIVHAFENRKKDATTLLVIPKPIKERMKIRAGDEFLVEQDGDNRIVYQRLLGNTKILEAAVV